MQQDKAIVRSVVIVFAKYEELWKQPKDEIFIIEFCITCHIIVTPLEIQCVAMVFMGLIPRFARFSVHKTNH